MSKPELKVVGEINPPDYRDAVKMLRNLADDIEAGEFGEVNSIALVRFGDDGLHVHAGGRDSDAGTAMLLLMSGVNKLTGPLLEHGE